MLTVMVCGIAALMIICTLQFFLMRGYIKDNKHLLRNLAQLAFQGEVEELVTLIEAVLKEDLEPGE